MGEGERAEGGTPPTPQVYGASKVLVRRVTATSGDPKSETLAKGIGIPDTARGKAASNPALTHNLIKGKTTRATPRRSKAPSSHLEGGSQVAVASARTKALIRITPSPLENATPPRGGKMEGKAKSLSLTRKTKRGRPSTRS